MFEEITQNYIKIVLPNVGIYVYRFALFRHVGTYGNDNLLYPDNVGINIYWLLLSALPQMSDMSACGMILKDNNDIVTTY